MNGHLDPQSLPLRHQAQLHLGLAVMLLLLLLLLKCTLPLHAKLTHSAAEQEASLAKLFSAIDSNADGQLDAAELHLQAAGLDLQREGWSAQAALEASRQALDGPDAGATVSPAEIAAHLVALLQDHRVEEWVAHGLNLPQYAPAFRQAAITALDFPFLVSEGGASLQDDLGITSKLHQQQILRGIKRLVLGLGEVPGAPHQLECVAANKSALRLSWQAPAAPGHPAFHKYVLQRQRLRAASGSGTSNSAAGADTVSREERWETVTEADDEDKAWLDLPPATGAYRYRLAAWSPYGHSPYAVSSSGGACAVRSVHQQRPRPQLLAPADVQALLAVVAAAGNLSAGQAGVAGAAGAAGGVWSWSAASSAAVVTLTILLKASQLRAGSVLLGLWRRLVPSSWLPGWQGPEAADECDGEQPKHPAASSELSIGGMRRAGSSRTLLASFGCDPGAAEEEQQLLLRVADGSMLRSYSSTQLVSGGEQDMQFCSMRSELPGWDAAERGDAAAEQLQQAVQRGVHCAHPCCHRRFDRLRDMRRKLESHHCGLCQRMYCLQHTRISPHGPRGGCGLESQCICYDCFSELAPAQQAACERMNRLPKPGVSLVARSAEAQREAAAVPANGSGEEQQQTPSGDCETASTVAVDPTVALPAAPDSSAEAPQQVAGSDSATSSPSAARRQWRKLGMAMRAILHFKAASSDPSSPR